MSRENIIKIIEELDLERKTEFIERIQAGEYGEDFVNEIQTAIEEKEKEYAEDLERIETEIMEKEVERQALEEEKQQLRDNHRKELKDAFNEYKSTITHIEADVDNMAEGIKHRGEESEIEKIKQGLGQ